MAINWVARTIRGITCRKTLWPVAKLLMQSDGPKAPTAVHGPLGITYHLNEKANVTGNCLEKQFSSHDLYVENHERQMETRI
jgi:hypothetical protein